MTTTKKMQKASSSYKILEKTKKCCYNCCIALKVASNAFKRCYFYRLLLLLLFLLLAPQLLVVTAAPSSSSTHESESTSRLVWPPMKHHDIWLAADAVSDVAAADVNEDDATAAVIVADGFNSFDATITNGNDLEFGIISSDTGNDIWRNNTISNGDDGDDGSSSKRQSKVIHLFPVPVDGECLSDDGRRTGTCFNAYECRLKGGKAKGECAMGFGVCCICKHRVSQKSVKRMQLDRTSTSYARMTLFCVIANCNETIMNNITYLVSPNFPSFMPNNFSSCSLKVKMLNADISQLRIDFYHFSLGQPNRRTGNCDGDIFTVSGGPSGAFSLCGQNSGQHIYYDVGGRALPRQTLYGNLRPLTYNQLYPNRNATSSILSNQTVEQLLEITMNFAHRFLPIRLWEIRIAQIPFSQRAPAGCLQYFTGTEGVLQTFNFAENGRHLANQHYRICMRQETEMCSIMYQTCDDQSFRIGPSAPILTTVAGQPDNQNFQGAGATTPMSAGAVTVGTATETMGQTTRAVTTTTTARPLTMRNLTTAMPTTAATITTTAAMPTTTTAQLPTTRVTTPSTTIVTTTVVAAPATAASTTQAPAAAPAADDPNVPSETPAATPSSTPTPTSPPSTATSPLSDDIEGSGGGDDLATPSNFLASRRPRPVSGGFDILGFLRNALDFRFRRSARAIVDDSEQLEQQRHKRQQRQFFSSCTDRITMPCIIEDFIGAGVGFGPLPGCEPVHCGTQFCSSGMNPCRIESTVTPFYVGVHFGDGIGKGSAEDNIGMCLRYTQVQCM